ncbi:hypothetical protein BABINDRAFT_170405 [Babjeviella inositovora NRRL Y-12698]|uniref:RNA exonuclease 4 n=1 Tax=Babjeviella inositovora NRRL Y-12698 TaxID=984486 RepID=A0A1E3QVN4_9ASCO|nr:uncharacterized protein BABINDRAFT_170405 [Babjeviella inositovora NRRL Y-12698]ODQ81720.1 hypothetical protein BABINDRAFT_170405 [Babjeviella inositovora NRRL Y-12698]
MAPVALSSNWLKLLQKNKNARKESKKGSKKDFTDPKSNSKVTKKAKKPKAKALSSTKAPKEDVKSKIETEIDLPRNNISEIDATAKETNISAEDLKKQFTLAPQSFSGRKTEAGKYLSMDCEFVGIGPEGKESALARVSIVNFYGHVIYDTFVKPREKVTDWRTWVSGVTPRHMKIAVSFQEAQKKSADLLNNKVLVGHAIQHDLDALFLSHPKALIRDTSKHPEYRKLAMGKTPSLKKLTKEILGLEIQGGEHSSVEDARATMMLYRLQRAEFEKIQRNFGKA